MGSTYYMIFLMASYTWVAQAKCSE